MEDTGMDCFLRAVHFLELGDSSLKPMLHSITKFPILLSNLLVGHRQDRLYILESVSVTFDTFECLGTTDQCLDILRFDLQHSSGITDDTIKVTDLLVASCEIF